MKTYYIRTTTIHTCSSITSIKSMVVSTKIATVIYFSQYKYCKFAQTGFPHSLLQKQQKKIHPKKDFILFHPICSKCVKR